MCTHIYDWVFMYIRLYVHYLMGAPAGAPRYLVHPTDLDIYETDFKRRNIHVHDSKWYVFVSLSYIAYCLLHIVHCLLPVAFCLLPLASCPLCFAYRIANVFFLYCLYWLYCLYCLYCLLPNAYCLLQTKPYIHTHLHIYTQKNYIYIHTYTYRSYMGNRRRTIQWDYIFSSVGTTRLQYMHPSTHSC